MQGGLKGAADAAMSALMVVAPEIGVPLKIVSELAKAVVGLPENLARFAEGINRSNQSLAVFAPRLLNAQIQLAVGDLYRRMDTARATEQTAGKLAENLNKMRDAFQPWDQMSRNVNNTLAIGASSFAERIAQSTSWIAKAIDYVVAGDTTSAAARAAGRAGADLMFGFGPLQMLYDWLMGKGKDKGKDDVKEPGKTTPLDHFAYEMSMDLLGKPVTVPARKWKWGGGI